MEKRTKKQQRVGVWKRDVEEVKEVTSSTSVEDENGKSGAVSVKC